MVEIRSRTDLRAWLDGKEPRVAAVIAARAAARVTPRLVQLLDVEGGMPPREVLLPCFRATLISLVASQWPTSGIRVAAYASADAAAYAAEAYAHAEIPAAAAADAAYAAADATTAAAATDAAAADATASYAADDAATMAVAYAAAAAVNREALWHSVDCDCVALASNSSICDLLASRLWPIGLSESLRHDWHRMQERLGNDPAFAFWLRWYQRCLYGQPLDWELQRDVAFVPREIWQEGPERVAEEIVKIEAAHVKARTAIAERIETPPEDPARIHAVPVEVDPPTLLETILNRINDYLDDALQGNALTPHASEARKLKRLVEKYRHDPQRVEMDLMTVGGELAKQMRSGDLPDYPAVRSLAEAALTGALDLRAANPEIAEARKNRDLLIVEELTERDRAFLRDEAAPLLREMTSPELGEQIAEDIAIILGDDDAGDAADSLARTANRAAKIRLLGTLSDVLDRVKKNPAYQATDIGSKINFLIDLLSGLIGL